MIDVWGQKYHSELCSFFRHRERLSFSLVVLCYDFITKCSTYCILQCASSNGEK